MTNERLSHHISRQFTAELQEVRNRVLVMGGLVEQQIADAMRAVREGSVELAEQVTSADYRVNAMEVAIDEECSRILVRRQPAATDLRMVIAVIKTIADLERMGDEAARIARMVSDLSLAQSPRPRVMAGIQYLGEHVMHMCHDALDAFARLDMEAAFEIVRRDRIADEQYEVLLRQLITFMMEDPRMISPALGAVWSARALERIGDHARNICEYVIYLVGGKDVRHTNLEQMESEIRR